MPITSSIDERRRLVVAKVEGDFTLAEVLEAISKAVSDPRFQPGFSVLSDHRKVGTPLTPVQAQAMVAHLGTLADSLAGARWAVVTENPASFGMLRMVSVLAQRVPMEVEVFPSLDQAHHWLQQGAGGRGRR